MCVQLCEHVCVCACMCLRVHADGCVHVCVCVYTCESACVFVHAYVCVCDSAECMYTFVCVLTLLSIRMTYIGNERHVTYRI